MIRRTQIINALADDLVSAGIVLSSNITRRLAFLHEVNDFPAISFVSSGETRFHYSRNQRFAQISLGIRGFVYDEYSVGLAEQLGRDIEAALDRYARSHADIGLVEARVVAFRTDEGLYDPYGIADLDIEITYEVQT
jgi:hypothetical protein